MKRSKLLVAVVGAALVSPFPAFATINSVVVSGTTITISGASFGTAKVPVVTLGGAKVTVGTGASTATSITGTLAAAPPPGSYRLTVQTWSSSTRSTTEPTYEVTVGAVGPVGPPGPMGPAGSTGAVGPAPDVQSFIGSDGPCSNGGTKIHSDVLGWTYACNGVDGADGLQGSPGLKGDQGIQGPKGDTGPAGPRGPTGTCSMPTCAEGQVLVVNASNWVCRNLCGGMFVDTLSDPKNCGACGATCFSACEQGVCSVPACSWTEVAYYDLTSAPLGAVAHTSPIGTQGPASVAGRTAWLQTGDWNHLNIPSMFSAADDLVAIEADVYIPTLSAANTNRAHMQAFDSGLGSTTGVEASSLQGPGSTAGAIALISVGSITPVATASTSSLADRWITIRMEGRRSTKTFEVKQGSVSTSPRAVATSLSGEFFALGSSNLINNMERTYVAWSNFRVYIGSGNCGY